MWPIPGLDEIQTGLVATGDGGWDSKNLAALVAAALNREDLVVSTAGRRHHWRWPWSRNPRSCISKDPTKIRGPDPNIRCSM